MRQLDQEESNWKRDYDDLMGSASIMESEIERLGLCGENAASEGNRLEQVWARFMDKVKTGNLRNFTRKEVEILLREIGLEDFLSPLLQNKVVGNLDSQLDLVDWRFFQDMKLVDKFPLGARQRLLFHLEYIKDKRAIFDQKNDHTFRKWNIEEVSIWLDAINESSEMKGFFRKLGICGIALSNVRKEDLTDEILKLCHQESYLKRRQIRQQLEECFWTHLQRLRNSNGIVPPSSPQPQPRAHVPKIEVQPSPSHPASEDQKDRIDEEDIPEQYICPITQEIMKDPVTCKDGSTYERSAIEDWIEKKGTSPLTREPLTKAQVYPARALKGLIESFSKLTHCEDQTIMEVLNL